MSYTTYKSYKSYTKPDSLIPPHGGYRKLVSFQMAEIVFDYNQEFTEKYIKPTTRTFDQRIQAGRSGKQNTCPPITLLEPCTNSTEKARGKLRGVAETSLLLDTEDFLRKLGLPVWGKDDPRVKEIRALAYKSNRSYTTYKTYISSPETAANCLICLIHQTNFLLDRQLKALSEEFLEKGGFTERLYNARKGGK